MNVAFRVGLELQEGTADYVRVRRPVVEGLVVGDDVEGFLPVGEEHFDAAAVGLALEFLVGRLGEIHFGRDVMDIAGQALGTCREGNAEGEFRSGEFDDAVKVSGVEVAGHKGPYDLLADDLGRSLPFAGDGDVLVFRSGPVDAQQAQGVVGRVPDLLVKLIKMVK